VKKDCFRRFELRYLLNKIIDIFILCYITNSRCIDFLF